MTASLPRCVAAITQGISEGLHIGAQLYVSVKGQTLADEAFGHSRPGVAMTNQTLMPWLSSGKPITAAAIALLWQRGMLALDDPLAKFIPEFAGGGKDSITIRHGLTHTAGIRAAASAWSRNSYDEIIAQICASKIEPGWVVGKSAGYHVASTWYLLGEVIYRLTRQPPGQFVRDAVLLPLEMDDTWIGMPPEVWQTYGERLGQMQLIDAEGARPQTWENWEMFCFARPANNVRGPIRELGRFYEAMLRGNVVLNAQTVEAIVTPKRVGIVDQTFKAKIDWGLGFICNSVHYGHMAVPYQFGPHASPRAFGHAGNQSSIGMADPEHGLVVAAVFNGMPGEAKHDRRAKQVLAGVYEDLGLV